MTRALTLYPAIDLRAGQCVRLRQGEMDDATVYGDDPGAQAATWAASGCAWLHVIDLDGAFAGRSVNVAAVEAILAAVTIPVQLGGGLRDLGAIEAWLARGIRRVLLGSAAVKNPALVRDACAAFPGRVAIGIDARAGMVATEGWVERSELEATELARRVEQAGAAAIVYTEITRDGMLDGLDLDGTARIADLVRLPVIASGGVGSLAHLEALAATASTRPSIEGVIVGRALYDGRIAPRAAIDLLAGREALPC